MRRFVLRRPPRPWGLAFVALLVGLAVARSALVALPSDVPLTSPELWLALAAVVVPPLLVLFMWPRAPEQLLEVHGATVRFPAGAGHVDVPIQDIEALILDDGPRPGLFCAAGDFATYIPATRFSTSDDARAAYSSIRERLGELPDGSQRLLRLEQLAREDEAVSRGRPIVTELLVALNVLVFLLVLSAVTSESPLELVRFGVNARALVAEGQVWRLLSANFLHANAPHVMINALSLLALGTIAERLLGRARFLALYLGSAIFGATFSAAFQSWSYTVGASTALFGVFGAMLLVHFRHRAQIPVRYRLSDSAWLWMLVLNVLLSMMPIVDWVAHLGGFIGGVLLVLLLVDDDDELPLGRASWSHRALAAVLVLGYAIAGVRAVEASRAASREDALEVGKSLVDAPGAPASALNAIAWFIAIDPYATDEQLALSQRAAQKAVDLDADATHRDTLATALYRRGEVDAAIVLESDAVIALPDEASAPAAQVLAAQAARFLLARRPENGPLFVDAPPSAVSVSSDGARPTLELAAPPPFPVLVDVVALDGDTPVGLIRFVTPGDATRTWTVSGAPTSSVSAARTSTDTATAGVATAPPAEALAAATTTAHTATIAAPPPLRVRASQDVRWRGTDVAYRVGLVRRAPPSARPGAWTLDAATLRYP